MTRTMTRFAVAAALFAIAGVARAAPQDIAPTVTVAYGAADLATPAAYDRLQQRIAHRAGAFCRANPVLDTVSACTRALSARLLSQAETRRQEWAKANDQTRLANR